MIPSPALTIRASLVVTLNLCRIGALLAESTKVMISATSVKKASKMDNMIGGGGNLYNQAYERENIFEAKTHRQ